MSSSAQPRRPDCCGQTTAPPFSVTPLAALAKFRFENMDGHWKLEWGPKDIMKTWIGCGNLDGGGDGYYANMARKWKLEWGEMERRGSGSMCVDGFLEEGMQTRMEERGL
jgi:hypothetical protein